MVKKKQYIIKYKIIYNIRQTTAKKDTTVAAAAAAAPQPARPAASQTGLARRQLGRLGRRCCRCCRHCGIPFIAVVCRIYILYHIIFDLIWLLLTGLLLYYI